MKKQFTLFLIDDDEDDRDLFRLAIEETDSVPEYFSAASCSEALAVLHSGNIQPDLIFLDLNMPKMNGKACLLELKKNADSMHIPVVIFTTSNDPNDIAETRELGAVDFITKPSKISELSQILDVLIEKHLTNHIQTR